MPTIIVVEDGEERKAEVSVNAMVSAGFGVRSRKDHLKDDRGRVLKDAQNLVTELDNIAETLVPSFKNLNKEKG